MHDDKYFFITESELFLFKLNLNHKQLHKIYENLSLRDCFFAPRPMFSLSIAIDNESIE